MLSFQEFSGKQNQKNLNLLSAEFAKGMLTVKNYASQAKYFPRKEGLTFHVNCTLILMFILYLSKL